MSEGTEPVAPGASGAWTLLRLWSEIGLKSVGGGASTQLQIRRTFVDQRGWVGDAELAHLWNLCQFTPGINLIALTILIGRKLGGTRGIIASVLGMLLPSAIVTCGLTAGFVVLQHNSALHAILRGVVPATAGIMAVVAAGFARPVLEAARKEGAPALLISVILVAATALAIIVLKVSVILVVVVVALLGATFFTSRRGDTPPVIPGDPSGDLLQT
jgi:chromate transporter